MDAIFSLNSDSYSTFWQKFGLIVFWLSALAFPIALWFFIDAVRKYETRKKQLRHELNAPYMKDVKYLFKPLLKEYGIFTDDKEASEKEEPGKTD